MADLNTDVRYIKGIGEQRAKALGKLIVAHCEDESLVGGGYIHDGAYARAHGRRELRGPGTAALAMSAAMLRAQSMLDPSTSRLAERMIQGSTMGAVQMTRRLHQLTGRADPALVELGQRLLRTEEQNIQEMKRFL